MSELEGKYPLQVISVLAKLQSLFRGYVSRKYVREELRG